MQLQKKYANVVIRNLKMKHGAPQDQNSLQEFHSSSTVDRSKASWRKAELRQTNLYGVSV